MDIVNQSDVGNGYGYLRVLLDGERIYVIVLEVLRGQDARLRPVVRAVFDSMEIDRGAH